MEDKAALLFIGNFLPVPRYNKNIWHFLAEKLAETGWTVITTSSKERKLPRLLDMLLTTWKTRHSYEVAHIDVFSGKAFVYAFFTTQLLSILQKTIVLTLHGGRLPDFSRSYPRLFRRVLTTADVIVTPSAFLKTTFTHIRSDIVLIPNPIDLKESIYQERLNASPELIWLRAFHKAYNPSMAIKVLYLISARYPQVQLFMLGPDKGDGSLDEALELAESLNVRTNLEIVGHVSHEEIPKWLNKGDIFINTSNYDTAPRSLLEAMANGLCVVSTNVGGIPCMVIEGQEALLVKPDDTQSMAMCVTRILEDSALASNLSRNARLRAEQSDWSVILLKWDKLFTSLLHSSEKTEQ